MGKTVLRAYFILLALCIVFQPILAMAAVETDHQSQAFSETAFQYATAPDGLYPFIYEGRKPYLNMEIDTLECEVGKLYVYDITQNTVRKITTETVTGIHSTREYLFYITASQKIYRTDYTGNSHELIYSSGGEQLAKLNGYFQTLCFRQGTSKIVVFDCDTHQAEEIAVIEGVTTIIMISEDTVISADTSDQWYSVYIPTRTVTELSSGLVANNMITAAVLAQSNAQGMSRSVSNETVTLSETQSNDIPFPLSEYPAKIYRSDDNQNFKHERPISWYHDDKAEGCSSENCKKYMDVGECHGFAMYAHDVYYHVEEEVEKYYNWDDQYHAETEDVSIDTKAEIRAFFANLKTGAFIRYWDTDQPQVVTPIGSHSVVFVAKDDNGVWVYECNQGYDEEPDHGCGVFLHYYTYAVLSGHYEYVVFYVNHDFSGPATYESDKHHKLYCTEHVEYTNAQCTCYVRQPHSWQYSYTDCEDYTMYHLAKAGCCSLIGAESPHIFINGVCRQCNYIQGSVVINRAKSRNIQAVNFAE